MADETLQPPLNPRDGKGGGVDGGGAGGPPTVAPPVGGSGGYDPGQPTKIGPYYILEILGEGGMGTVYKAEQRHPIKRLVALKLIKAGYGSREAVNRFNSERQALARMDHPNIAKVLDAGTSDSGQPYFVMEYVPGVPLTAWADQQGLTIRQRMSLFIDVCGAISHAHGKALLHRDIKGNNVLGYLADGKPTAKVIDFGIAKALGEEQLVDGTLTSATSGPVGTLYAMPPEQVEGSADIDTRADVYSLGVLLYELLCGRRPFELKGKGYAEVLEIVRTKEPPEPSRVLTGLGAVAEGTATDRGVSLASLVRELRRELDWVPLKAMRKERERRYESVAALAEDCRNYLEGRALEARPEDRLYRLRKFLGRNRVAVAAGVVVVVAGLGAVVAGAGMLRARLDQAKAEVAAQGVEGFAEAAFFAGNPTNSQGKGGRATVADTLVAGFESLKAGVLDGAPQTKARLLASIGRNLRELEYERTAHEAFDLLLATYRSYLPEESREVAMTYIDLGVAGVENKVERLIEAQAMLERLRLTQSAEYATVLAQRLTDPSLAPTERERMADLSLQLVSALDPAKDDIGLVYLQNGVKAEQEKSWDRAVGLYRKAVDAKTKRWGENAIGTALALNNLGFALNNRNQRGDRDEAIKVERRAIDTFDRMGIRSSRRTMQAMILLANMLRDAGQLSEAEKTYRDVFERFKAASDEEREKLAPDMATAHSGLGKTLLKDERLEDAIKELEAAFQWRLANAERVRVQGDVATRMNALAAELKKAYEAAGRPEEAAKVYGRLIQAYPELRR